MQSRETLMAELGAAARLRNACEPYPVKLKGFLGATDIDLEGMIADPLAKQGLDVRVELNRRTSKRCSRRSVCQFRRCRSITSADRYAATDSDGGSRK
jgi:hypothetical protein